MTFNTDVLDPAVSMTLLNEHRQPVVVATTAEDHEETGGYRSGRTGTGRVLLPQHARARALSPDPDDHSPRRRPRRDRSPRGRPLVRRLGHDRKWRDGGDTSGDGRQPRGAGAPDTPVETLSERDDGSATTPARPFGRPSDERIHARGRARSATPIRGPRALDDSWSRLWHLAYNIARSEFKLKFFGSALGYLWQVVRPLLLFGVLYVFFVEIFHVDRAKGAAATSTERSCSARSSCSPASAKPPAQRFAASSTGRTSSARSSFPAWPYRSRSCCSRCSTWR